MKEIKYVQLSIDKKGKINKEKEAQIHFTRVSRINKCTLFNHVQQIKWLEMEKMMEINRKINKNIKT